MEVQVFGVKKSVETRSALRFFAERRVRVHFVDCAVRGPSKGELTRFVQKFGVDALIDRSSKRFLELGWGVARYSDQTWLDKLVEEPFVLKLPLVRYHQHLTVGAAEPGWKTWS